MSAILKKFEKKKFQTLKLNKNVKRAMLDDCLGLNVALCYS